VYEEYTTRESILNILAIADTGHPNLEVILAKNGIVPLVTIVSRRYNIECSSGKVFVDCSYVKPPVNGEQNTATIIGCVVCQDKDQINTILKCLFPATTQLPIVRSKILEYIYLSEKPSKKVMYARLKSNKMVYADEVYSSGHFVDIPFPIEETLKLQSSKNTNHNNATGK